MKVKIVYRNYKPLHKIYESLIQSPPTGVQYTIKRPVKSLDRVLFIYKRYRDNFLVKKMIGLISTLLFAKTSADDDADVYHYVSMVPNNPNKPFIVDIEHVGVFVGFAKDDAGLRKAKKMLLHPNCLGLVCISEAGKRTVAKEMSDVWEELKEKTSVIYPTIPLPVSSLADYSIMSDRGCLNFLFVGNESNRKGLPELLEAMRRLNEHHGVNGFKLFVVSDDAQDLVTKYNLPNVHLYPAEYSKQEILQKFFLPADLFVYPTRVDTFGFVIVDALASGTPVMATRQFAIPEIIDDGRNGLLLNIDSPPLDTYMFIPKKVREVYDSPVPNERTVADLVDRLSSFLRDRSLLRKYAQNTRKDFLNGGRFAVQRRNSQYVALYRKAIKT